MLNNLKIHHFGIIIDQKKIKEYEFLYKKKFLNDTIQKTRVMFVYDNDLKLFREFIVKEGRVNNLKLGFAHTCYLINNKKQLLDIENYISEKKLGYQVTNLEKSVTNECGFVKFFYLKKFGLIELNLINND